MKRLNIYELNQEFDKLLEELTPEEVEKWLDNDKIQQGYSWIKVPKYEMNDKISWKKRYEELDAHHIEETTFLIDMVREISQKYEDIRRTTSSNGDKSL